MRRWNREPKALHEPLNIFHPVSESLINGINGSSLTRVLIAILSAIILTTCILAWLMVAPPGGGSRAVIIPEGATPLQAGNLLADAEIVASAAGFQMASDMLKREIKPGRYFFKSGVYPWVAVRILAKGTPPEPEITVTIPEGKRLIEIASILDLAGAVKEIDFLRTARDPAFIASLLGNTANSLEGYLFPDTYKFKPNSDAESVICRMHQRFLERSSGLSHPLLSPHEFVTMASIVEREAQVAEERPRIAGVYLRRLAMGMRLEADPTVRFAVNKWDTTPVLYVDLESTSPYNTYRVAGLPPGPICSPGRASLEAVAQPLETRELFFVARGDGSHAFAENFRGHRANIAAVRR